MYRINLLMRKISILGMNHRSDGLLREHACAALAVVIDRILKGEKPAALPVQAPTKFELVINMKTAKALGIDANVGYPAMVVEIGEVQAAARTLGLEVATSEIRQAEDIAPAFEALKGRADALYVCADALVVTNRIRINTLAQGARLLTMYGFREFVEAGGLMSYGPNLPDLFRRAAELVDKILRGTKPGDIPVEQPTKFDLVINLTTAKALGLTIPETFLLRADEVIE
jgi:putative ABC transport system substrate-binding protein